MSKIEAGKLDIESKRARISELSDYVGGTFRALAEQKGLAFTIHVEAVTSLVGRAELLAAVLVFAVARLWLRATEGGTFRPVPYALALALFLVSVFVKENAIVAPGVVLLGELFRGGRGRSPREALRELSRAARAGFLGFLGPIAAVFAVRIVVIHGFLVSREAGIFDLENPLVVLAPGIRVVNALGRAWRYAWKKLLPGHHAADHTAYAQVSDARPMALPLECVSCSPRRSRRAPRPRGVAGRSPPSGSRSSPGRSSRRRTFPS